MAKTKAAKKEPVRAKTELNLDRDTVKKLEGMKDRLKTKLTDDATAAAKEVHERYHAKITLLTKAKADLVKRIDAEIKEYTDLAKKVLPLNKKVK